MSSPAFKAACVPVNRDRWVRLPRTSASYFFKVYLVFKQSFQLFQSFQIYNSEHMYNIMIQLGIKKLFSINLLLIYFREFLCVKGRGSTEK